MCICEPDSRTGALASGATPAALPLPPPGSPQGRAPAQMSPYCPQPPTRLGPRPHPRDPNYLRTAPETVTVGSVPTKALWKPGLTVFHFPGAGFHFPAAWGWDVACCICVCTHVCFSVCVSIHVRAIQACAVCVCHVQVGHAHLWVGCEWLCPQAGGTRTCS